MAGGLCNDDVTPPRSRASPTAEEQKAIDTFAPRVIAAARQEGLTCATVTFAMLNMPNDGMRAIARPSWYPCEFYVQINPRVLHGSSGSSARSATYPRMGRSARTASSSGTMGSPARRNRGWRPRRRCSACSSPGPGT